MLLPDLITLFITPLNRIGVTYMITGSVASSIYGQPRLTNDIDLVITLSAADAARLHHAFDSDAYYIPPLEVIEAERQRSSYGHFNLIHMDSAAKADLFLVGDDSWTSRAVERRRQERAPTGEPIWIAPPEYVILNKLRYLREGGSEKHRSDIQDMLSVLDTDLDRAFLLAEVHALGLLKEWESVIASPKAPA